MNSKNVLLSFQAVKNLAFDIVKNSLARMLKEIRAQSDHNSVMTWIEVKRLIHENKKYVILIENFFVFSGIYSSGGPRRQRKILYPCPYSRYCW